MASTSILHQLRSDTHTEYGKQRLFPQFAVLTPKQIYEASPVRRRKERLDKITMMKFVDPVALSSLQIDPDPDESREIVQGQVHSRWSNQNFIIATSNKDDTGKFTKSALNKSSARGGRS